MFRALAALALASTTAHTSPALNSTAPWWERVTVTVTDDGQTRSCRYESSRSADASKDCSVIGTDASMAKTSSSSASGSADKASLTRITFERRFSPTATAALASLQPGETLLGGQVMALAIDGAGAVKGCKILSTSGSVTPQYGCDQAASEHFQASAAAPGARHAGYMTILVYGHSEHVV